MAGAAAPKTSEVDEWLERHSTTHEKYTGQDLEEKGPLAVPEASLLDQIDFEYVCRTRCSESKTIDEAIASLPDLPLYGLKALSIPPEANSPTETLLSAV